MIPMNMIGGAVMDLGLAASTNEADSEAEKSRKKKLLLQQQRQGMQPYAGAAGALLSGSGNQY